jgi:hypothetical protein
MFGFLPKNFSTSARTSGIRVIPPTSTTSLISFTSSLGIGEGLLHWFKRRGDQIPHQFFELGPSDFDEQVLGTIGVSSDKRLVDFGFLAVESSILAFSAASLMRWRASGSLDRSSPSCFLNSSRDPMNDALVEVITSEVRITIGRAYFYLCLRLLRG